MNDSNMVVTTVESIWPPAQCWNVGLTRVVASVLREIDPIVGCLRIYTVKARRAEETEEDQQSALYQRRLKGTGVERNQSAEAGVQRFTGSIYMQ